jgi:hypothetical protein
MSYSPVLLKELLYYIILRGWRWYLYPLSAILGKTITLMPNINIQKIIYQLRHRYLTVNNVIIAVAFLIAASWVWGSLDMMQRNYVLQRELDHKMKSLELTQLQRDNMELERRYYQTAEYQELKARTSLGLVRPGERAIVLPANTVSDADDQKAQTASAIQPSNFEQWMNFLFGGYSKSIDQ